MVNLAGLIFHQKANKSIIRHIIPTNKLSLISGNNWQNIHKDNELKQAKIVK